MAEKTYTLEELTRVVNGHHEILKRILELSIISRSSGGDMIHHLKALMVKLETGF